VAYERLRLANEAAPEKGVQISRMLLEIGHPKEALVVLNDIPRRLDESIGLRLLRSAAYAATGDYPNAIEQCEVTLKKEPNESGVRLRMARLEQQAGAQKAAE
jgi:predicted Zn-dependent protease